VTSSYSGTQQGDFSEFVPDACEKTNFICHSLFVIHSFFVFFLTFLFSDVCKKIGIGDSLLAINGVQVFLPLPLPLPLCMRTRVCVRVCVCVRVRVRV
jgi:hypothetical protein